MLVTVRWCGFLFGYYALNSRCKEAAHPSAPLSAASLPLRESNHSIRIIDAPNPAPCGQVPPPVSTKIVENLGTTRNFSWQI